MAKKVLPPTLAETAQINRGVAADPDNPEWTDADFARARPAREVLPPHLYKAAVKRYRGQRGPQKSPVKKSVTLRLDPDILAGYKAMGPGWQTRMNEALRRALTNDGLPRVRGQRMVPPPPSQRRDKVLGESLLVKELGQAGYGKKTKKARLANAVRRARRQKQ